MKKPLFHVRMFGVFMLFLWGIFPTTSFAAHPQDVVINELMWMGSESSTADEWIELKNMTDTEINISGWEITKHTSPTNEVSMLTIPSGKTIPAHGFFLISNSSETNLYSGKESILNTPPHLINTAVDLSNGSLKITLYDGLKSNRANIVDIAGDGGTPFAGMNTSQRSSMARKYIPGDGTLVNNWFSSIRSRQLDLTSTSRATPGKENNMDFIITGQAKNGKKIETYTSFGELISSFSAFNDSNTNGINISLSDIDKNGSSDIIAGKYENNSQIIEVKHTGERFLINGNDNFISSANATGVNIAACDLDGDGFKNEIAVGKRNGGNQVILYDSNGINIRSFTVFATGTGVNLACGNFDADPQDEIVVGKESGGREIKLYENDGTLINTFTAFSLGDGANVATGNIDSDPEDEIIIGKESGGREIVILDTNGVRIRYFEAFTLGDGANVSTHDLDNDGKDELIIGKENGGNEVILSKADGTRIRFFKTITGSQAINVGSGIILMD